MSLNDWTSILTIPMLENFSSSDLFLEILQEERQAVTASSSSSRTTDLPKLRLLLTYLLQFKNTLKTLSHKNKLLRLLRRLTKSRGILHSLDICYLQEDNVQMNL